MKLVYSTFPVYKNRYQDLNKNPNIGHIFTGSWNLDIGLKKKKPCNATKKKLCMMHNSIS